jgi:hypothetical protein
VQAAADVQNLAGSNAAVTAGNLRIRIGSRRAHQQMKSMQKLALFCRWLKQHAGVVGSISFEGTDMEWIYTAGGDEYNDAAEQLLALGLQEAAAAAAAPMRTALQPRSCSISCIRSEALLLALPASVTHLNLTHSGAWRSGMCFGSSGITAAVAQLSQLRSLILEGEVGNACLAAVGQLAHLTRLEVNTVHVGADGIATGRCDLHLLPQQLQSLEVTVSSKGGPATQSAAKVALQHSQQQRWPCNTVSSKGGPATQSAAKVALQQWRWAISPP